MTRMDELTHRFTKLLEAMNEANDLARSLGVVGNLFSLKTNMPLWREFLKQAHTKDKADMVAEVVLSHYPSGCIQ
jgi:hypothetical protein